MANIQIQWIETSCSYNCSDFNTQCCTECANDLGCLHFDNGQSECADNEIPFGDCKNVIYKKRYKGITTRQYEMEEREDIFNPHLSCMIVKVGRNVFHCTKVTLDGVCIYQNSYFNEETNDD